MKIRRMIYSDGTEHYLYKCPGCKYEHAFSAAIHQFNGDREKPTISPSLLHSNPQQYRTCHSFIIAGTIQFLSDCWHELAGRTVDLPDYPEGTEDYDASARATPAPPL